MFWPITSRVVNQAMSIQRSTRDMCSSLWIRWIQALKPMETHGFPREWSKLLVNPSEKNPQLDLYGFMMIYDIYAGQKICYSARVKSYQLVKVVSGGRAPGKSSSLASPQLLVIERFHCLGPCAWKKFNLCIALIFKTYTWSFFQGGKRWLLLACCLPAIVPLYTPIGMTNMVLSFGWLPLLSNQWWIT